MGVNNNNNNNNPYKNNASLIYQVSVDIQKSDEDIHKDISNVVRNIVLRDDDNNDAYQIINISSLSGGLSNHLYVVTFTMEGETALEEKVLVRIHCDQGGDSDDDVGFVNRDSENQLLAWLSAKGFAPSYYGRFSNGRIEEFLEGYRTLTWNEMASFGERIALPMAKLHALQIPTTMLPRESDNPKEPDVWKRVNKWIHMAQSHIPNQKDPLSALLQLFSTEWEWLQTQLWNPSWMVHDNATDIETKVLAFCNEIVLTHMDCQSLNIMIMEDIPETSIPEDTKKQTEEPKIKIIDYEYAAMNARVSDIANTFCEHCDMNNLQANYETQFPTTMEQDKFLRTYISHAHPDLLTPENEHTVLQIVRTEVGKHTLISHLSWAIWSIAQHYISSIEFDYVKYAKVRLEGYQFFKSKYWP